MGVVLREMIAHSAGAAVHVAAAEVFGRHHLIQSKGIVGKGGKGKIRRSFRNVDEQDGLVCICVQVRTYTQMHNVTTTQMRAVIDEKNGLYFRDPKRLTKRK